MFVKNIEIAIEPSEDDEDVRVADRPIIVKNAIILWENIPSFTGSSSLDCDWILRLVTILILSNEEYRNIERYVLGLHCPWVVLCSPVSSVLEVETKTS